MKRYAREFNSSIKANAIIFVCSICLFIVVLIIEQYCGTNMLSWCTIHNPFILGIGISIFNMFSKLNLKSRAINYLASLTLPIYIIHENLLIRNYIRPLYFNYILTTYTYDYLIVSCLIGSAMTFVISIILATVYKETLGRLVNKLSAALYRLFGKLKIKLGKTLQKPNE